jgi:hypothetical protein
MLKRIECRRQQSRADGRYDFLVTGLHRRAIHVFCSDYDLTEHEWYWTLQAAAIKAAQLKWKHTRLVIFQKSDVYIKNLAGHAIRLGAFDKIAGSDHFLNDDYYTPKGFWIKNSQ